MNGCRQESKQADKNTSNPHHPSASITSRQKLHVCKKQIHHQSIFNFKSLQLTKTSNEKSISCCRSHQNPATYLLKRDHRMQNSLYKLFEHKCVLKLCIYIHPIMLKTISGFFFYPYFKTPFLKSGCSQNDVALSRLLHDS